VRRAPLALLENGRPVATLAEPLKGKRSTGHAACEAGRKISEEKRKK
jgi:hypothetical protein